MADPSADEVAYVVVTGAAQPGSAAQAFAAGGEGGHEQRGLHRPAGPLDLAAGLRAALRLAGQDPEHRRQSPLPDAARGHLCPEPARGPRATSTGTCATRVSTTRAATSSRVRTARPSWAPWPWATTRARWASRHDGSRSPSASLREPTRCTSCPSCHGRRTARVTLTCACTGGAVVQEQLWYRDPKNTSNQATGLFGTVEFLIQP